MLGAMTSERTAVEGIVARWEWRTFGERFGGAESRLSALSPERVRESDETYVVSSHSDASAKVRDGLMDVKELLRVDGGLEQWRPVMKAAFPLPAAQVRAVLAFLGVTAPTLTRDAYTFDQIVHELVDPSPDLLALEVHKRRTHYTLGGCMAELSQLRTNRGASQTIGIESEDPDRVAEVVRGLGLDSRANVNLPRWLKTMAGLGAHRYAVIDVGTSSVKFYIGERTADGEWRTVVDRAEVTRLGEGLDAGGRLREEPIERTVAAMTAMAAEAHREGAERIAAVGTAAMRLAPNRAELIEAARERAGVELEVTEPEEEARLAFLAVRSGLDLAGGSLVVFDSGGGSSQFTFGRGDRIEERFSVNVGAVRSADRYGLAGTVSESSLASALDSIAAELERLDGRRTPDALVGMGGTVTNLTAVRLGLVTYDPDAVPGGRARPRGDRSPDRALPHQHRRGAPPDPGPTAQPRGGHPRRRLHRPHGALEAGPEVAGRQRPRPTSSAPGRAVRVARLLDDR
jgi:exopolyphosphatase / guanosine-5'-triphosphate,3'-diphosphate pyrophosphatase